MQFNNSSFDKHTTQAASVSVTKECQGLGSGLSIWDLEGRSTTAAYK